VRCAATHCEHAHESNHRVSTLDHQQLMAEFDRVLLVAYNAYKTDQKAFATEWPRAKAMPRQEADVESDYGDQKCAHCSFAVTGIVPDFCCRKCKVSAGFHGEKCTRRVAFAIERRPEPSAAPGRHQPKPSAAPEQRPHPPLEPPPPSTPRPMPSVALQPRGSVARALRPHEPPPRTSDQWKSHFRVLAAARLVTLKNSRADAALRGAARLRAP
jgi:hypothetical protein